MVAMAPAEASAAPLVEDTPPASNTRAEGEAVGCNRVAEQGSDCSIIFGGKIRLHDGNMRRKRSEVESGPATLGTTAKAHLLLRVWCKDCRHEVDLDPAEQAERYGADLPVPEWADRLTCSRCGSRQVDFVVTYSGK